jgi:hypothetical protein
MILKTNRPSVFLTIACLFVVESVLWVDSATAQSAQPAETLDAGKGIFYPETEGPFGYGIFEKIRYEHMVNDPQVNIDNPYLAGAELLFTWSSVEADEGRYHWETLDRFMDPWFRSGKKIILGVRTVQKRGRNPTASSATPAWVFEAGAEKISTGAFRGGKRKFRKSDGSRGMKRQAGGQDRIAWPVYWDPVYLEKYGQFVKALAGKYDGNPGVEFIEIGLGQFGSTKIAGPNSVLDRYREKGYTETLWVDTMKKMIEMYRAAFKKTPLAIVVSPFHKINDQNGGSHLEEISRYAAGKGIYLYNHALTGNDKFTDQNPFPALFHSVSGRTKTAFGPDNPLSGRRNADFRKYGRIGDAVENAFGGIRGLPETHISYLLFYVDDVSASDPKSKLYNADYEKAMRYAAGRLGPGGGAVEEGS